MGKILPARSIILSIFKSIFLVANFLSWVWSSLCKRKNKGKGRENVNLLNFYLLLVVFSFLQDLGILFCTLFFLSHILIFKVNYFSCFSLVHLQEFILKSLGFFSCSCTLFSGFYFSFCNLGIFIILGVVCKS